MLASLAPYIYLNWFEGGGWGGDGQKGVFQACLCEPLENKAAFFGLPPRFLLSFSSYTNQVFFLTFLLGILCQFW